MLRTKSFVSTIADIPRTWVFEHYLQLGQKLTGQDVKMKSPFSAKDNNPSFFVYYAVHKRGYRFKDFSADKQGDGTELVMHMFNLTSRGEAAHKIIDDYNINVINDPNAYAERIFKIQEKYKLHSFNTRTWTQTDQKFWTKFKIGSKTLDYRNVKPLKDYVIRKQEGKDFKEITISGPRIYGFFREDGTLYKIYQPMSKGTKYSKVKDYIQGTDQLTFEKPYLIIASSLKDMMSFAALQINNAELVAPDSENVLIPKHVIEVYKERYQAICTLFDNDPAGIKSMIKYKEEYDIPYAHLKLEGDLAEAVEAHGVENTRIHLRPILIKALKG